MMGIERKVRNVIEEVMKKWKTLLEIRNGNKLLRSWWIDIKRRILQGDTNFPVGYCCTDIPVMMLLEKLDGYKLGPPGKREIKHTQSLSVVD